MTKQSESIVIRWNGLQKRVAKLLVEEKHDEAIALLDVFIAKRLNSQVRSEALALRGDFKAESGKKREAIIDYQAAISLVAAPTFARHTVETALAVVHEELGERSLALKWYHRALETALEDPGRTGVGVILRLASLDKTFESVDRTLCERVMLKAWRAAGLRGDPDLTNLAQTANEIMRAPR